MRYSSPLEIITMIVVWAAILIVYDITQRVPAVAGVAGAPTTPQLSMWLQHIGCTEKAAEVDKELRKIAWLDQPVMKQMQEPPSTAMEGGAKPPEGVTCDRGVIAPVRNLEAVDFMDVVRALRAHDIVPTTLEFGGVPHFALKAKLANLCETCGRVAMDALAPRKDAKGALTLKWLDSRRVNPKDQSLTAFVRLNNVAHIDEMIRALEQAGLPPLSIRIVIE
ncbi:MAG: hypothetical protein AB7N91_02655 [Candidatus Tectimicrobiota bacterium]